MNTEKDKIWSTENLVMFGMWLVKRGDYGHGLLCIHGACLGIKVGSLLKLTWGDFIDYTSENYTNNEEIIPAKSELVIASDKKDSKRIYDLSFFIQRFTRETYIDLFDFDEESFDKHIYIHSKTGKVLTTTSLNKELNRYYEQYSKYVLELTGLGLRLREPKTNAMEIAWGRDMVKKYGYSKKAFIELSKYMGHRTVADTINLLELEPIEEIKFSFDLYNPEIEDETRIDGRLTNAKEMKSYLFRDSNLVYITSEYFKHCDTPENYDMRTDNPNMWKEIMLESGVAPEDLDDLSDELDKLML